MLLIDHALQCYTYTERICLPNVCAFQCGVVKWYSGLHNLLGTNGPTLYISQCNRDQRMRTAM